MTEAEWFHCADPTPLLDAVEAHATERQYRLFAVACYRHYLQNSPTPRYDRVIEVIEQVADGDLPLAKLTEFRADCNRRAALGSGRWVSDLLGDIFCDERAQYAAHSGAYEVRLCLQSRIEMSTLRAEQAALVRDVFRYPEWEAFSDRTWISPRAADWAKAMYQSRDFAGMSILGDFLEEAGCPREEVLNHCRSAHEHYRGCWVVDLLMGQQ